MTPKDIANELKSLSVRMVNLGTTMDYYGGFNGLMAKRGAELIHAGQVAESWAQHIEHELWEQSEGAQND
jgi:creatinine amidohydrolase/Fe(II)-dependent formamide hydrolase-like protein